MASFYVLILLFACVISVHPQKFEGLSRKKPCILTCRVHLDESVYMKLRWLDMKAVQVDDEQKPSDLFTAFLFLVETGNVG